MKAAHCQRPPGEPSLARGTAELSSYVTVDVPSRREPVRDRRSARGRGRAQGRISAGCPTPPVSSRGCSITAARSCRSSIWGSCWARRVAAIGSARGSSWSIAARPLRRDQDSPAKLPGLAGKTRGRRAEAAGRATSRAAPLAAGPHRRAGQRCLLGPAGAGDLLVHSASPDALPGRDRRDCSRDGPVDRGRTGCWRIHFDDRSSGPRRTTIENRFRQEKRRRGRCDVEPVGQDQDDAHQPDRAGPGSGRLDPDFARR